MIKLIVFDLYNTLIQVSSRKFFFRSLYQESTYLKLKYSIKEFQNLVMTNDLELLLSTMPSSVSEIYQKNHFKLDEELESITVFDGVEDFLSRTKENYKIGLISNLATPYRKPVYNLKLSDYFDEIIFSCDVGFQKPDKRIFELMERRTGLKKSEILMVGDSFKSDYLGSLSVGWKSFQVVSDGKNRKRSQVSSILDLESFIISNSKKL